MSVLSGVHTAPQQPWPVAHVTPQAPQAATVSRPLQTPTQHVWLAPQARLQAPQWAWSTLVSTQWPPQHVFPVPHRVFSLQASMHVPPGAQTFPAAHWVSLVHPEQERSLWHCPVGQSAFVLQPCSHVPSRRQY